MSEPITALVDALAAIPGSEQFFNPYADADDSNGAPDRRANLTRYLMQMQAIGPRAVMLAEAPGYRGCALTGIPVTSERIMLRGVPKWGLFGEGYRPTSGHPEGVAEASATILWGAVTEHLDWPPLLWNTVPLHPHKPGNRQSNRTPTTAERRMGAPFLQRLFAIFPDTRVLAVGRTAARALAELGYEGFVPLRHPSQGGKRAFVEGLARFAREE
jgi:hypothetical protein